MTNAYLEKFTISLPRMVVGFILLVFSVSPVLAEDTYIGVDFGSATLSLDGAELTPSFARFRIGINVLSGWVPVSVESHLSMDLTDDTGTFNGTAGGLIDVDVELNRTVGLYARVEAAPVEEIAVYGLFGITSVQLEGKFGDPDANDTDPNKTTLADMNVTDSGFSYAIGVNGKVFDDWMGYVEYMHMLSGDDFDVSAFSIGVHFNL